MRTVRIPAPARAAGRITGLVVLLALLAACDRTAPQAPSTASAADAPASAKPAAIHRVVSPADAALAVAMASDQASRAAREQTLRVQRQLVEQRRAERDAAQRGNGNERCLSGQKMRRVANGWVQAGAC